MNRFYRRLISAFLLQVLAAPLMAADYDLVINNGRVMDPETKLDAVRNVGIKNGIITKISQEKLSGKEVIDAKNHVVAPGFIDTHFHGMDAFGMKLMARDGVTTALELEIGAYPVEDFYNWKAGKSQLNYGASVGHAAIRLGVPLKLDPKGDILYSGFLKEAIHDGGSEWNTKPVNSAQKKEILDKIEDGLKQGGLGIGFPIGYYTVVGADDVMQAAALARKYNQFITSHVRYLSQVPPSGYIGLEEMLTVASINKVPFLMHHLPSNCLGKTTPCIELLRAAREIGLNVAAEFYPYTFASSIVGADYLAEGFEDRIGMDVSKIINIATQKPLTTEDMAKLRKEAPDTQIIFYSMTDEQMMASFREPGLWVGSDNMPFVATGSEPISWDTPYGQGSAHPRAAGTHARVLRLNREKNIVPMMEAIAKLSYHQAKWLEPMVPDMRKRGRIQEGAVADITIFDPQKVTDNADWAPGKNSLPSTGIPYVIVNGTVVVNDSKVQKVFPGQPIRNAIVK
ncbi:amidohydrolase family protein [Microbulbifer sp. SA54]|uniref:amidohydrolase family protein n=1 Tax=Microbulbifer sp. SA54 TaxID=3401577 RepID=UPI003AB073ED